MDYIDVYFSHWPDADTPYEETLGAYEKLLKARKIRAVSHPILTQSSWRNH